MLVPRLDSWEAKKIHIISNQRKALSLAFPIIGQYLAWKVDSGSQVRIGTYAIVGCGDNVFLPKALVVQIWETCQCTLNRIGDVAQTTIWR